MLQKRKSSMHAMAKLLRRIVRRLKIVRQCSFACGYGTYKKTPFEGFVDPGADRLGVEKLRLHRLNKVR